MTTDAELLALYGRVEPYGTVEPGTAPSAAPVRPTPTNVWLPGPFPVCSPEHAARWREYIETRP